MVKRSNARLPSLETRHVSRDSITAGDDSDARNRRRRLTRCTRLRRDVSDCGTESVRRHRITGARERLTAVVAEELEASQ